MTAIESTRAQGAEDAVRAAALLLTELRDGHRRLEARAERVEAELCRTNEELAQKLDELELVQRRLEAVLRGIPTGVVVYDEAGNVTRVNAAAVALLGADEGTLAGTPRAPGLAGSAADGRRAAVLCGDGVERVLTRRYSPIALRDGTPVGAVETLDDQTELAHAEARMRRLARAAALGTMVGGVAHEVRNPLHAIGGFAELLQREAAPDSRAARHAARIREGVADLESIVTSMLGVAGQGRLAVQLTPLRPLAEAAVEAALPHDADRGDDAGRAADPTGRWTVELDVDVAAARLDPIEVRQALRNLVANACDAQPDGGRVAVHVGEGPDGDVTFTVDDAGPGVPDDARERLFDPFFTTRAAGTGLGLALVLRVAELHGGTLEVAHGASPLGGARFVLRIPAELPTASASAQPEAPSALDHACPPIPSDRPR